MEVTAQPLLGTDPDRYLPHPLHDAARLWPESNCYVDFWIELLHLTGNDPYALLGCALAPDFEGDQWTFFKPSLHDLRELYGIVVEELQLWRSTESHLAEQLARGRIVTIEVDSHFLPDTAATSYRRTHGKTTIVPLAMSRSREELHYLHNGGCFRLSDQDYRAIIRADQAGDPAVLRPYAELIKLDAGPAGWSTPLPIRAAMLAGRQAKRRAAINPIGGYAKRFPEHVEWVREGGQEIFHAYAFAHFRQLGASQALAADFVRWLAPWCGVDVSQLVADLESIASDAMVLQFKTARAAASGKALDARELFARMEQAWERSADALIPLLAAA